MYTFTYLYINICVFVRIYTYWDVPPPSSSHQQHILTFWLGGFTITFHCEWERSIPIYTNMYIYALFSRCTYYIYSTYCRCIGYIYIYIYTSYVYHIYRSLPPIHLLPVSKLTQQIHACNIEAILSFFSWKTHGKIPSWYSPTMRGLVVDELLINYRLLVTCMSKHFGKKSLMMYAIVKWWLWKSNHQRPEKNDHSVDSRKKRTVFRKPWSHWICSASVDSYMK